MLFALETTSPFLPITSLQLQYFQAVTNSFVRRHSTIPPVFNNFRTLSVATGVVPLSVSLSVQLRLPVPALNCLAFYPFRPGAFLAQSFVSFVPRRPPSDRTKVFWLKNNSECKILSRLPSPFNAVYRHSMHGNTVRRKVWSHTANSGRLDVELLGAPRSCSIAGYTCGLRGGTISRAITEGEECRM